ncbi:MAG: radical SAM protein, partial [Myxococcota bacterium]
TAFVVVGGYHATLAPHDIARCQRVDAIAIGEGERSLEQLLGQLEKGRPDRSFPGMWVRDGDDFDGDKPAANPELDIAQLPRWDYDVFGDIRAILKGGVNTFGPHVDGYLPVRAGRGCPFTCAYCSAPAWGEVQGFRRAEMQNTRPVAHLCDELVELSARFDPEGFEFWDEHFPVSVAWLEEFAATYPVRVGRPFKVEMHPNAATRERLKLLVKAGCTLFHCGVEAGDETLRRTVLNRRTSDERLQRVFEDCRELGLKTSASLMTVLPSETRAQAHSTVALLERLRPDSFMWSTYQPLPGTVLGDAAVTEWPDASRETFDDHDKIAGLSPSPMTEGEKQETYRELVALQSSLVQLGKGRLRARPLENPTPGTPPTDALAALLGEAGRRVRAADWDADVLKLEVVEKGVSKQITVAQSDGSPAYKTTMHLSLAYRGREAPPWLLQTLDAIAAKLRTSTLAELKVAQAE